MDAVNLLSGINAASSRMRGSDVAAQDSEQKFNTLLLRNEDEHTLSAEADPDAEAALHLAEGDEVDVGIEMELEAVAGPDLTAVAAVPVAHELMVYAGGAMRQTAPEIEAAQSSATLADEASVDTAQDIDIRSALTSDAGDRAPTVSAPAFSSVLAAVQTPQADVRILPLMSAPSVDPSLSSASLNESLALAAPARVADLAQPGAMVPAIAATGTEEPSAMSAGADPIEQANPPLPAASVRMPVLGQAAPAGEGVTVDGRAVRPVAEARAQSGLAASMAVPQIEATDAGPAVITEKAPPISGEARADASANTAAPDAIGRATDLAPADLAPPDLAPAELEAASLAAGPAGPASLTAENSQILQGQLGDVMRSAKIVGAPRPPRGAQLDPAKAAADPVTAPEDARPVLSARLAFARSDAAARQDMPEPKLAAEASEQSLDGAQRELAPRVQMSSEGSPVVRSFDLALRAVNPDAVRAPLGGSDALTRTVADSLQSVDMKADGTTVMRLRPHGLGMIEVEIGRDADERARVVLRIQNPMVLEALRADKGAIHDLLSQNGLSGASVELGQYQSGSQSGQGGAQSMSGQSMSGQPDARRSAGDGAAQNTGGGAEAAASDDPATEAGILHPGQSVNILI